MSVYVLGGGGGGGVGMEECVIAILSVSESISIQ